MPEAAPISGKLKVEIVDSGIDKKRFIDFGPGNSVSVESALTVSLHLLQQAPIAQLSCDFCVFVRTIEFAFRDEKFPKRDVGIG